LDAAVVPPRYRCAGTISLEGDALYLVTIQRGKCVQGGAFCWFATGLVIVSGQYRYWPQRAHDLPCWRKGRTRGRLPAASVEYLFHSASTVADGLLSEVRWPNTLLKKDAIARPGDLVLPGAS